MIQKHAAKQLAKAGSGAAAADEEPGPAIQIHKPTAPKSLAEFLSEIGVIVVALGGEQTEDTGKSGLLRSLTL